MRKFPQDKDPAANVVRFAKAMEEEQPLLLQGIRQLSVVSLPHAESGLHRRIKEWGLALPIDVYLFNKGILFAPMCLPSKILEFYLCRKPAILFGGFDRNHFALDGFLQSFWECYRYEDEDHQVFQIHGSRLNRCFPICIYADEGRGLRKAPIQVVALETLWGIKTFSACEKLAKTRGWNSQTFLGSIRPHWAWIVANFSAFAICSTSWSLQKEAKAFLVRYIQCPCE